MKLRPASLSNQSDEMLYSLWRCMGENRTLREKMSNTWFDSVRFPLIGTIEVFDEAEL